MYVITRATGNTGTVAARRLLVAGQKVRVIGKSAENLQPLETSGAESVLCNLTDSRSLTKAFTGARAVYAMVPPSMTSEDYRAHQDYISDSIATAIENAGVEYAVSLGQRIWYNDRLTRSRRGRPCPPRHSGPGEACDE